MTHTRRTHWVGCLGKAHKLKCCPVVCTQEHPGGYDIIVTSAGEGFWLLCFELLRSRPPLSWQGPQGIVDSGWEGCLSTHARAGWGPGVDMSQ
jgi:hypothetical protein